MDTNEVCRDKPVWFRGPLIFFGFIASLVVIALIALIMGYFVMLLWNWLMPVIFHLGVIDYWQAFGIVVLAKLLFGTPGLGKWSGWNRRMRKMHALNDFWKSSDDWELRGGWDQWRYYKDYWRSEGKEAFEKYINKMHKKEGRKK